MVWREQLAAARRAKAFFLIGVASLLPVSSACEDLPKALQLARNGERTQARQILTACEQRFPRDSRVQVELAGLDFVENRYSRAGSRLRAVIDRGQGDEYVYRFLGTIHFLQRNPEAALQYWNRADEPRTGAVHAENLPLSEPLKSRTLRVSPGAILRLEGWETTIRRIEAATGTEPTAELTPLESGDYAARFSAIRNSGWPAAAGALKGLPYQALLPVWRNIGESGWHVGGLLRWDAQKRRASAWSEGPLQSSAKWRWTLGSDFRRETWNLGDPADFRLETARLGGEIRAIESGRFEWGVGLHLRRRDFGNAPGFESGTSVVQQVIARYRLLDLPQHRLRMNVLGTSEAGRWLRQDENLYGRFRGDVRGEWYPQPAGERYVVRWRWSAGRIAGSAPLDELFILGVERDTDLWLRAHPATYTGRKGSGAIGTGYTLFNWELSRQIARAGFVRISAGPFLDTGRGWGNINNRGLGGWMIDAGLQLEISVPGNVGIAISYGRKLRGSGGAFYASPGLFPGNTARFGWQ